MKKEPPTRARCPHCGEVDRPPPAPPLFKLQPDGLQRCLLCGHVDPRPPEPKR